jgi:hypothetical protein
MSTATAATTETGNVDIAADRVGKIYAQAIVEAAEAAGCRREVLDELGLLAREVLPKVPQAEAVFSSPKVSAEEKAAMIDKINRERKGHILTVEDPIEFVHRHQGCIVNQREVGTGYFDAVTTTIERESSTAALKGSTEDEQFFDGTKKAA